MDGSAPPATGGAGRTPSTLTTTVATRGGTGGVSVGVSAAPRQQADVHSLPPCPTGGATGAPVSSWHGSAPPSSIAGIAWATFNSAHSADAARTEHQAQGQEHDEGGETSERAEHERTGRAPQATDDGARWGGGPQS